MSIATSPAITATFVGGPTVLLRYHGLAVLTDPTFDEPADYAGAGAPLRKLVGPALQPADLGHVDLVLLSHDQHADNLDVAGRAFLTTAGTVLSTPDAAERVAGVRGLDPWERVTLAGPAGDVHVTAVPARHGPEGCEPVTGAVTGFVLEAVDEHTVYVSGDNASLDVVDAVARRFDIDVAVLFVGRATVPGRFDGAPLTLDAQLAAAAAELLAPATIIPVHHTDWAHFQEPLSVLVDRFEAGGRSDRLVVVPRGATTEL